MSNYKKIAYKMLFFVIIEMVITLNNLKVVFMGTPDFAVPVLQSLIDATNVVMVVCQPDKLVGRKQELEVGPIKRLALEHNIKVFQPNKIREDYEEIMNMQPDIIITCAYGQIIPTEILNLPRLGCINVHASLLPKWRGGAPIHHALINGDRDTGVTIMYMDEKMDTGNIISQVTYQIKDTDNVGTLHDELSKLGSKLLIDTLPSIINGTNDSIKQDDSLATYAKIIKREDEHLDFNNNAVDIYNKVRGLYPFPKANAIINNEEVKILECFIGNEDSNFSSGTISVVDKDKIGICTKDKIIYVTKVKPFGKKEMAALDYINGQKRENLLNTIVK